MPRGRGGCRALSRSWKSVASFRRLFHLLPPTPLSLALCIVRPLLVRVFAADEIHRVYDYINRQTYVNALVEHPRDSIVEYPETGTGTGLRIAHLFSVDHANFSPPKETFQYPLGDSQGGGTPTCMSAEKEIFSQTLGFYYTLADKGCAFDLQTDGEYLGSTALNDDNDLDPESSDSDSETDSEIGTKIIKDARRKPLSRTFCKGKRELHLNEYGRCEHRKKTDRAHLILRTLDKFDNPYLRALLENDCQAIEEREELARKFGYGPLVPCSFNASPSVQKELCRAYGPGGSPLENRRAVTQKRAERAVLEVPPTRLLFTSETQCIA
ncbi:hypothetical protein DFH09DRAFT_1075258 [Mycena vulgaris]|nr:hypothetical protein DFH09DRAFT_1075258 [Mycena vulgaris]